VSYDSVRGAAPAPTDAAASWRGGTPVHDRSENVCVIGAGACGLTAIKNLREYGFGVDCYERETGVGGAWNWRHDRSPVYASTHLISSKPFTQFPDFPMPDSWPDYPHHTQVLAYLERYADHFGLRDHIWFGTEVTKVEPAEDGRWDVTISGAKSGGSDRTQRYAAVVVANGHNWSPKFPTYEGLEDFKGEVIHASAYKDAAQLRGRRVLVVGAGNTGCDIAVEAAQQASRCWHSSRRGYWYAPKYAYGRPSDQVNDTVLSLRVPLRMRQWLFHRTMRRTVGDLTGKVVGVGAVDSPQATLLPLSHLRAEGLSPGVDVQVRAFDVLAGKHGDHVGGERDAAVALLHGEVDAACLIEGNHALFVADGTLPDGATRVLTRTPAYDHCNLTVTDAAPQDLVDRFRELLLGMSYDVPEVRPLLDLEGLRAWRPGRTHGYRPLEAAVDESGFYDADGRPGAGTDRF